MKSKRTHKLTNQPSAAAYPLTSKRSYSAFIQICRMIPQSRKARERKIYIVYIWIFIIGPHNSGVGIRRLRQRKPVVSSTRGSYRRAMTSPLPQLSQRPCEAVRTVPSQVPTLVKLLLLQQFPAPPHVPLAFLAFCRYTQYRSVSSNPNLSWHVAKCPWLGRLVWEQQALLEPPFQSQFVEKICL